MKLFRNREIAVMTAVISTLGALAAAGAFFIDPLASAVCGALTLAVFAAYIISVKKRYKKMEKLAESIETIVSEESFPDLSEYGEGEFAILKNKIEKLIVLLRHRTDELTNEKKLLADSIADISHQIRTPLTAVNLILAALDDPSTDEARKAELKTELDRRLARIDRLVSSLLKLAKLDADSVVMEPEKTALSELIQNSVEPVAIQMELKEQSADISAEGFAVIDRSWTAEALTNIIKNCSEHMGAGTLHMIAVENPLYSEIVIRDEGPGIDREDLPHIFERFYKGKNSAPSSVGIGLALARMIITKQNGTIKAENAKEGGAKFTVRFYRSAV